MAVATSALAADGSEKPVSYWNEVVPIFKRSCTGCHHPGKQKGELDLTTYDSLKKGGKHGAAFVAGNVKESRLAEVISGPEPSMPKEGDPLSGAEVALIERWIQQGARNDSPALAASGAFKEPPVYMVPPVISALAFSPDGQWLAVSGYHEVLIQKADGSELVTRLVGDSPRVESLAFSPDGKLLVVSGGAAARFGEVQIWDVAARSKVRSLRMSTDCLYGASFSPDSQLIAVGGADKSVRTIRVSDGKELVKFDNHSDWVLATTFTADGKRLLSGSRDRAMKLIAASSGQFIDDINKLIEGVLCLARHPKLDQVVYGGDLGGLRLYRMADNQQRTAANNDANLLRDFERQPGPVRSVAISPDGELVAAGGSMPEIRVYKTSDGSRVAALQGNVGSVFALAFHPSNGGLASGGYDGKVRIFDVSGGKLRNEFIPVPTKGKSPGIAAVSP